MRPSEISKHCSDLDGANLGQDTNLGGGGVQMQTPYSPPLWRRHCKFYKAKNAKYILPFLKNEIKKYLPTGVHTNLFLHWLHWDNVEKLYTKYNSPREVELSFKSDVEIFLVDPIVLCA